MLRACTQSFPSRLNRYAPTYCVRECIASPVGKKFHSRRVAKQRGLRLNMGCSYALFLAVASLLRRRFSSIQLKEVTAALDVNGLSEVEHVRLADIPALKLPLGSQASLRSLLVALQQELLEGCTQHAPPRMSPSACPHTRGQKHQLRLQSVQGTMNWRRCNGCRWTVPPMTMRGAWDPAGCAVAFPCTLAAPPLFQGPAAPRNGAGLARKGQTGFNPRQLLQISTFSQERAIGIRCICWQVLSKAHECAA